MYHRSIFLFRRDLRLVDNNGLRAACAQSERVIPAFVFDPRQCDPDSNSFFSEHAFAFLTASLRSLARSLDRAGGRLFLFEGDPAMVVRRLIEQGDAAALFINRDYTPFSRRRDNRLQEAVAEAGGEFHVANDLLLTEPEDVVPDRASTYTVYSQFRRRAQALSVARPNAHEPGPFWDGRPSVTTTSLGKYDRYPSDSLATQGGREHGLALLAEVGDLAEYRSDRHRPSAGSYTRLSAHHKFGTVSIRESLWTVKDAYDGYHKLISQLYWRDFYTHLLYHRPRQLTAPLLARGQHLDWRNDRDAFDRWCAGATGVPFVDAGMRELNATGYMHNRARMTVASFLTKDLLTDWRWGAQYFARTLTDYDPAVNAGNWQWSASVGTDYKIRIYNPYLQAKKHDPDAHYIRRWVPELRDVEASLLTSGDQIDFSTMASYPAPIVDRTKAYHRARSAFRAASEAVGG